MHTALHVDLKNYIVEDHSPAAYTKILESAGFPADHFDVGEYFSDGELEAVLAAAATELGMSRDEILAANGEKAAGGLLEGFKAMIDPAWKTLDLVEAVEGRMHKYAREEMAAFPPVLKTERVSPDHLIVRSRSHRNLWALAVGFMRGFAKHYEEEVGIDVETQGSEVTFTLRKTG